MAVYKGRSRKGGGLFSYIMGSKGDNDAVELLAIKNCVSQDPKEAAWEMEEVAKLSRSTKPFYHGQLSLGKEESKNITNAQYIDMINIVMSKLECPENTKVMISKHTKNEGCHIHYGFLRHNLETGKVLSDSYNYYKHDAARAEIEQKYDLVKTPKRNPNRSAYKADAKEIWDSTTTGQQFFDAMKRKGYSVAISVQEGRPYRLIDAAGRNYNLVREIKGVKTAEVRERLKDVKLPMDKDVMNDLRKKQAAKAKAEAKTATVKVEGKKLTEQEVLEAEREEFRKKFMKRPDKEKGFGR